MLTRYNRLCVYNKDDFDTYMIRRPDAFKVQM